MTPHSTIVRCVHALVLPLAAALALAVIVSHPQAHALLLLAILALVATLSTGSLIYTMLFAEHSGAQSVRSRLVICLVAFLVIAGLSRNGISSHEIFGISGGMQTVAAILMLCAATIAGIGLSSLRYSLNVPIRIIGWGMGVYGGILVLTGGLWSGAGAWDPVAYVIMTALLFVFFLPRVIAARNQPVPYLDRTLLFMLWSFIMLSGAATLQIMVGVIGWVVALSLASRSPVSSVFFYRGLLAACTALIIVGAFASPYVAVPGLGDSDVIRLSTSDSLVILNTLLTEDPRSAFFGSNGNGYEYAWGAYQLIWADAVGLLDVRFLYASSLLLTLAVTHGLLITTFLATYAAFVVAWVLRTSWWVRDDVVAGSAAVTVLGIAGLSAYVPTIPVMVVIGLCAGSYIGRIDSSAPSQKHDGARFTSVVLIVASLVFFYTFIFHTYVWYRYTSLVSGQERGRSLDESDIFALQKYYEATGIPEIGRFVVEYSRLKAESLLRKDSAVLSPEDVNEFRSHLDRGLTTAAELVAAGSARYQDHIALGNMHALSALVYNGTEFSDAIRSFSIAHELMPQQPAPHYFIAQLRLAEGDVAESLRLIKKALTKQPTHQQSLELRNQIESAVGRVLLW